MDEKAPAPNIDELAALPPAARAEAWRRGHPSSWTRHHPINIRLSLPLPGRRLFVTVVAGADKRRPDRRRRDRPLHPLLTPGNVGFLLLAAVIGGGLWHFMLRGLDLIGRL